MNEKPGLAKNEPGLPRLSLAGFIKRPQAEANRRNTSISPRLRALRVASPTPFRGQHLRPGEAGSAVFLEGALLFYQPMIMITPSTRKIAAEMPCTSLIGTRRTIFSPSHTTGALASIMPSVVPATTQK